MCLYYTEGVETIYLGLLKSKYVSDWWVVIIYYYRPPNIVRVRKSGVNRVNIGGGTVLSRVHPEKNTRLGAQGCTELLAKPHYFNMHYHKIVLANYCI